MSTFRAAEARREAGTEDRGDDAAAQRVEGPLRISAVVLLEDAVVRVVPALRRVCCGVPPRAPRLEAPYVLCTQCDNNPQYWQSWSRLDVRQEGHAQLRVRSGILQALHRLAHCKLVNTCNNACDMEY